MTHIAAIELLASQLKELNAPISNVQLMAKILLTLPPSFKHFASAWDSVPPSERTVTLLKSRLVKEEKMIQMYNKGIPFYMQSPMQLLISSYYRSY